MVAILLRKCLVTRDRLELATTTITSHPYPLNAMKLAVTDQTPKHTTFTHAACVLCGWSQYHSQVRNTYNSLQKYQAQKHKGRPRS